MYKKKYRKKKGRGAADVFGGRRIEKKKDSKTTSKRERERLLRIFLLHTKIFVHYR